MEKNISIEKIKALISAISLAVLTIQHWVGMLADDVRISYVPLIITFLTIFVSAIGAETEKGIRVVSLIGVIVLAVLGCIIYTLSNYDMQMDSSVNIIYTKIVYAIVGLISLILSILQIGKMQRESN